MASRVDKSPLCRRVYGVPCCCVWSRGTKPLQGLEGGERAPRFPAAGLSAACLGAAFGCWVLCEGLWVLALRSRGDALGSAPKPAWLGGLGRRCLHERQERLFLSASLLLW